MDVRLFRPQQETFIVHPRVCWQHHEYRGSIGFAAEYASPVEDLVSAFPSSFVLTTLLGMHPLLWFLWVAYRLQQTYEAHSGWVSHSA
jgi:sterol desaturase/sphingolipid hydroxylase (fatty acid hydroxylase superfamily)